MFILISRISTLLKYSNLITKPKKSKKDEYINKYFCHFIIRSSSDNKGKSGFGKYNYRCEIESAINSQINLEQHASQVYLAVACYFGRVSIARKGCYSLFMSMHKEEVQHAHSLIEYQLLRGGSVYLDVIQSPQNYDSLTIVQHFENALNLELLVLKKIDEIIKLANHYNDYQCADFLTSKFSKEQMESINVLASFITSLCSLGNSEENIFIFDLDLQNKFLCDKSK